MLKSSVLKSSVLKSPVLKSPVLKSPVLRSLGDARPVAIPHSGLAAQAHARAPV
ncbi:hypothetical protein GCM10027176_17600 [Actinoallomurus bryophytorum]|uniref:hypothetical protein n=1 Tax=Actinoallomurus bryophytorum TaxID=1490222 RepID=UPI00163B5731|nr:hypothetical protein [Actinoallomurus bryophytorum]